MPPVQLVPVVPVCTEGLCPGSLGWGSPSHKMVDHLPTASTIHCFRVVGFTQPQNGRSMGGTIYIYIYIYSCMFFVHTYVPCLYVYTSFCSYLQNVYKYTDPHICTYIYTYVYVCVTTMQLRWGCACSLRATASLHETLYI